MENVKIMSDSGTKIAANAETLSSKGIEIADETKALMQKANKLAEQVDELIQKFNKTVDKIGGQGKSTLQAVKFEATLSQQTKPNTLRADANIFVPIGKDQLMFGLYDAFESNKLNLQLKKQFGANLGLRYGAYASKPGIGVDYRVAPRVSMRGDLFGLNDPRFDARLGYDFGRDTTGWVGLDKIFERNSLSIGVTVRK
jgi:phospholipid/cholesterol/gamma-HCH transport system substrate-binding protein